MTTLQAGTTVTLLVKRETPDGYFLSNGKEDVLLHRREITESFDPNKDQAVFLYQDHQGRLTATMKKPIIQIGQYGWVEVVGVKQDLGVFVDIGISKDILVSKDDLPAISSLWPTTGDRLYCSLRTDKKGRLFGALATEEEIRKIVKKAKKVDFNKNINGYVYRLLKVGSFLVTEEGILGFVHESERTREPRLGEKVTGRIIDVKPDGSVNISLLERGYEKINDDAEKIYAYLASRNGAMPYWDKSFPEEIKKRFNMSKGAFKRALGKLMKDGKVYQEDGWTYFKK